MSQEIRDKVKEWLDAHEVTVGITETGAECPRFCGDKSKPGNNVFPRRNHIHGARHAVEIARAGNRAYMTAYWNSYHDAELAQAFKRGRYSWSDRALNAVYAKATVRKEKPQAVHPADVLYCLTKSNPGSFEDWCGEYGYETDSRKAESIYRAVVDEFLGLSRVFTAAELAELDELLSGY